MQAFVEVFKKLNLLRALEVKGAQLGAVAAWKRHQVGRRLGPVWVHGKGWRGRTMASAMYRSRKIDHGRGRGMLLMEQWQRRQDAFKILEREQRGLVFDRCFICAISMLAVIAFARVGN